MKKEQEGHFIIDVLQREASALFFPADKEVESRLMEKQISCIYAFSDITEIRHPTAFSTKQLPGKKKNPHRRKTLT